MSNFQLPSPAQPTDVLASLEEAISGVQYPGPNVSAAPSLPASTSYTYQVVAKSNGNVVPGSTTTITSGPAALTALAFNALSWSLGAPSLPLPTFDVYRVAGGATQGRIAIGTSALTLNDTGLAGDGTTAPIFNTSGVNAMSIQNLVQTASASGAIDIPSGSVYITKGSAAAMTLPAPVAGSAQAGGMDGSRLRIYSTTAFAQP